MNKNEFLFMKQAKIIHDSAVSNLKRIDSLGLDRIARREARKAIIDVESAEIDSLRKRLG
jgi:hypothetical protein